MQRRISVQESRGRTIGRRLRTIPAVLVAFVLVTVLLPVLLAGALVVDLVRLVAGGPRFIAVRLVAMLWCYLVGDTVGLAAMFGSWVVCGFGRDRARLEEQLWPVQSAWAAWMFWCVRRLFGMRLDVQGDEVVPGGPVILAIRHASIVDNFLPLNLVTRPHGQRLRYVLKRELLWEPCLDVGGKRSPNWFVRRDSGDPAEIAHVLALAEDLGPDEGVLIYPEGTRFTPERRDRGIARIAENDPVRAARLSALQGVLAPRTGGFLGILDGAPQADVLVCAHYGFDGLRRVSDIWRGGLVGRVISVRFTRIPAAEIPSGREERIAWLDELWLDMDAWVTARDADDVARLAGTPVAAGA